MMKIMVRMMKQKQNTENGQRNEWIKMDDNVNEIMIMMMIILMR